MSTASGDAHLTHPSSVGLLSIGPSPKRSTDGLLSVYFALKCSPPSDKTGPDHKLRKEDYWHMLCPLANTLANLRQDWHDLRRPESAASDIMESDQWRRVVRDRTTHSQDTVLDGRSHGPVRWRMHHDQAGFVSAPGETVHRFEGIDSEPWICIGMHLRTDAGHLAFCLSSWLYAPTSDLPYYHSALETMMLDLGLPVPSEDDVRLRERALNQVVGHCCTRWVQRSAEGISGFESCTQAIEIPDFDQRITDLAVRSVEHVQQTQTATIGMLDNFQFGVYPSYTRDGSPVSLLTKCHLWMSLIAE